MISLNALSIPTRSRFLQHGFHGVWDTVTRWASRCQARVRRISPDQWLLVAFGMFLLAFLAALLVEPTVGRGGR
jgi:hypothetical protein